MVKTKLSQETYDKLLRYAKRVELDEAVNFFRKERINILAEHTIMLGKRKNLLESIIDIGATCFLKAAYLLIHGKTYEETQYFNDIHYGRLDNLIPIWNRFDRKKLLTNYEQLTLEGDRLSRGDLQFNFPYVQCVMEEIASEYNYKLVNVKQLANLSVSLKDLKTPIVGIVEGYQGIGSHYAIEEIGRLDLAAIKERGSNNLFFVPQKILQSSYSNNAENI